MASKGLRIPAKAPWTCLPCRSFAASRTALRSTPSGRERESLQPCRQETRGFRASSSKVLVEDSRGKLKEWQAAVEKEAEARKKWAVLPYVKGRTSATHRMWFNRFLAEKQQQAIETTGRTDGVTASVSRPNRPRHMQDSYLEEILEFTNPDIREEYVNPHGTVRIGKVLEDLDALAGSIAYMHCDDNSAETIPLTIVTASLDRIDLLQSIPMDQDLRLSGHVTWVGSSSMEVSCWLETMSTPPPDPRETSYGVGVLAAQKRVPGKKILTAKFSMVARDPITGKAAKVNQLILETDEDRRLFRSGAEHKARKLMDSQFDLSAVPPSFEELNLVHELYKEYIQYLDPTYKREMPSNVQWMKDTVQQNLVMCMPQDRNIHGNVFGGYLLRLAFELASSTGMIFAKSRANFVALDDIKFKKPVKVGALLSLTSQVVYSSGRTFQVKVRADVIDPIKDEQSTTNTFHLTFEADHDVSRVMPRSYDESMRYIEGRRKKERWMRVSETNSTN